MSGYSWLLVAVFALTAQSAGAFDHQHSGLQKVLQEHVTWNDRGTATTVNYQALQAEPEPLKIYLNELSGVKKATFHSWSRDQQLAFLLNAYNAFTLQLIIDHYPLDSIRDIGFFWQNPWKRRFFTLLDEKMHLDQIEHDIIREPGRFNEPRIHFAVNCASIGCPALRTEPFVAEKLEDQLEDSTRRFLGDDTRNRYRDGRMEISSIFDWYPEDFELGWRGTYNLYQFLFLYADAMGLDDSVIGKLKKESIQIRFLNYDWSLNE